MGPCHGCFAPLQFNPTHIHFIAGVHGINADSAIGSARLYVVFGADTIVLFAALSAINDVALFYAVVLTVAICCLAYLLSLRFRQAPALN